ncbi:MAG: endonuclease, partial [Clostridium sp.]|nr:endonuclease [Clostridium sp.]
KGLHIDYIFVTEEFNVRKSEIIYYNKSGKYPSDHYPISAELEIIE